MTTGSPLSTRTIRTYRQDPIKVTHEQLDASGTELTGFFFRYGGNFYVFSYDTDGRRCHTFVDSGDLSYRERISTILTENGITPEDIERIIITHSHHDHFGTADLLAEKSGATILVHANFRSFVEEPLSDHQRRWLKGFDPSRLKRCNMEYLNPSGQGEKTTIKGLDFPHLAVPIPIGDTGHIEILACPESTMMHTTDQLIVRYSPRGLPHNTDNTKESHRPGDDILFSGDLWLMHGPLFAKGVRHFMMHMRFAYFRVKALLSGKSLPRRDPRAQDAAAKEALKLGFSLIRVMPGHGDTFLGSRLIPRSFLADRDLLLDLGCSMDADKSILRSTDMAPKVSDRREKAYTAFMDEVLLWGNMGYDPEDISEHLVSIYRDQEGGGYLVEDDRKERRERIKETLARARADNTGSDHLSSIAELTLTKLKAIA